MPLAYSLLKILNRLSYKYNSVATIKNWLRSIKYFLFGKSDISWVIDEIKRIKGIGNPVKTVFDVGAAIGDKTIIFLKSFPEATVYCFEPQQESLDRLKKRTATYKSRVKIFDFGFFNKSNKVFLNINSYRDASSILSSQEYLKDQRMKEIEKREIQVICLDDFAREQKIKHIDFIKIDVEGVEKEVLEGGKETFQNKIDNVFIEISPLRKGLHSRDHLDIFQFLYERGFTFIGSYGDYFFSKDKNLLKKYFG